MDVEPLVEPQPFHYLALQAQLRPGTIAISSAEGDLTYATTYTAAKALAQLLRQRGVTPGQVVACWVANHLQLLAVEACFHEAAIWCNPPSVEAMTTSVEVNWLLSHRLVEGFDPERTIVVDDEGVAALTTTSSTDAPRTYPSMDAVCRLALSSGTTGAPLAVPSKIDRIWHVKSPVTEAYPYLSLMRGFTGSSAKAALNAVCEGRTFICAGSPEENVALAQRNHVATLHGSPLQLGAFLDALEDQPDTELSIVDVQFIGSYLPQPLLDRLREVLGASVTALYGSTEVGIVTMRRDVVDDTFNVGTPLEGMAVEIVDQHHQVLPVGHEGTIRVRSARPSRPYFGNDAASAQHYHDDWFYPGDLGRLNTRGELELVGRVSEVINAGGVKFNPDVLDATVVDAEDIDDGAIISWLAEDGTSSYAALVVCEPDVDLSQLVAPLEAASGGAQPAAIFRVQGIERGPTGKVRRRSMADAIAVALGRAGEA